jgi:ribosomal protein S18 acetylase RimI-like enzyme
MEIRPYEVRDEEAVVRLWKACGLVRATNDPRKDIQRKLRVRPDLFLVGAEDGAIVATVMAGYEGHRGWLNYVEVAPERQGSGLARQILEEAERLLKAEGCAKINLQVRQDNQRAIEVYRRLGFEIDPVHSMGKRLVNDDPCGSRCEC